MIVERIEHLDLHRPDGQAHVDDVEQINPRQRRTWLRGGLCIEARSDAQERVAREPHDADPRDAFLLPQRNSLDFCLGHSFRFLITTTLQPAFDHTMPLTGRLRKSIKAREEESDDEPYSDELDVSSPSVLDTGEGEGSINSSETDDNRQASSDVKDEEAIIKDQLQSISFAALSKAQSSLQKRKRPITDESGENKLEALRERLRELKRQNRGPSSDDTGVPSGPSVATRSLAQPSSSVSESRTSKHAPASQSSKRAVGRARTIIASTRSSASLGDPRFNSLAGHLDHEANKRNYAFLSQYQESEINALKAEIKDRATPAGVKADLKKKLICLESKRQAQLGKDRLEEVKKRHREEEREKVREGKKPFYLKESELRKAAIVDKFQGMKGKEKGKAIERRRKKEGQKAKKKMPLERRTRS